MNPLLERISIDPNVCSGRPCIKGTRVWVEAILDNIAGGASIDEILAAYPSLTREDIQAALAYGAEMVRGRHVIDAYPSRQPPDQRDQRLPVRFPRGPIFETGQPSQLLLSSSARPLKTIRCRADECAEASPLDPDPRLLFAAHRGRLTSRRSW
jgi:uncharacterized protein (DUF433 family)